MSKIYDTCKICKEKIATPSHVIAAHGMKNYAEYVKLTEDKEFMEQVAKHKEERQEREEREYHISRLLIYHWYPKATSLTRILGNFTEHRKTAAEALNPGIDLSRFDNETETIVRDINIADALVKQGWTCVGAMGGHDGSPKRYHMRRNM